MAYGLDPAGPFPRAPLERQQAGLGEYLGAVADEQFHGNPLPSLLRWYERQLSDYGPLGRIARTFGPAFPALRGLNDLVPSDSPLRQVAPWLSKEEVQARGKELGLTLDRPMSEEALDSILAERRRRMAQDLVFQRAREMDGYGWGKAALSLFTEFAVNAADPLNIASAFVPVTRAPLVAARLGQIASPGLRRLATGAIEGAVGNVAVEPFVALAAMDEDPHYGPVNFLLTAAFGAALGGGLHWLAGRAAGRKEIDINTEGPLAPSAPRDALAEAARARGEAPASSLAASSPEPAPRAAYELRAVNERLDAKVPQDGAKLIDQASPETRDAALTAAVASVARDRRPDVAFLFDADGRYVGARATYAEETRFRQEMRVSLEELRAQQAFQTQEIARLKAETLAFRPPAEFKPSPAALAEARAVKAGKPPGRGAPEPESLATFVRRKGGISVEDQLAGDLRAQDMGGLSGLLRKPKSEGAGALRKAGHTADDMALFASEAGFYKERPTVQDFVADLIDDANGQRKTYSAHDAEEVARFRERQDAVQAFDQWTADLADRGIDAGRYDDHTLAYILSLDPGRQKIVALEQAWAAGKLTEAHALEVAQRLENEIASAKAEALAKARDRMEGFEPDLEAAAAPEYRGLTREEFDAIDRDLADLEDRSGPPPGPHSEPEGARAGAGSARRGADLEPEAAAAQRLQADGFDQATVRTEARIDAASLEAFARRQEDVAADLHADPDAAASAAATVELRSTTDIKADLAEVEASARRLLTDADKEALAAKDAAYKEEKAMLDAYVSCRLGGGE